jgi:hypothetical protein
MEQKYGDKNGQLPLLFQELDTVEVPKVNNPTKFDKGLKGLLAVPSPQKPINNVKKTIFL